jgi:hypothetical protein
MMESTISKSLTQTLIMKISAFVTIIRWTIDFLVEFQVQKNSNTCELYKDVQNFFKLVALIWNKL